MKKVKFTIIGDTNLQSIKDLKREVVSRNLECSAINIEEALLNFSKKNELREDIFDLSKADIFLFKGFKGHQIEMKIVMQYVLCKNKIVIDEGIAIRAVDSKVFQLIKLQKAGISIPETFQAFSYSGWKKIIKEMRFPAVIKHHNGSQGKDVLLVHTKKEAFAFLKDNPNNYMIQEYLEIDGDFRLFVVGNKVIGGIKRHRISGDFRTNVSLGAKVSKIKLTKEMKTLALKAAKVVGYEIAGVDLLESGGKLYVLEVNPSPQWEGFSKATGINPAKDIIDYALKKYNKKIG